MKKNPRNEIRGIVFLLVACLIWGIYVLNAEAATGCTLTVYDSQGNEVTNGSTARVCSNFSAKLTVPLSAFSGATNDTNNDFKADLNVSDGTSTYVHNLSGSIVGETVVFEIRGISCTTAGEAVFSVEVSRLTCNGTSVVVPDAPATTSIEIVKCEREVTGFSVTGYRAGSGESLIVDPGTSQTGTYNGLYYPYDGEKPEISYKLQEEKDDAYITYTTPEPPLAAGSYVARLSYGETNYYKPFSTTTTFTILPAYGYALSIQVADIAAGETPSPVVTDGENNLENNSEVKYVVEYKASDAADTAYSTTAPTAGGTYVARVSLYNSSGTFLKEATTAPFEILPAYGYALSIQVADIVAGETPSPVVTDGENNLEGNSEVYYVVEYKASDAADTAYSTTAPTAGGTYVARVSLYNSNSNAFIKTATTTFKISKSTGSGSITINNIRANSGVNVNPVVTSATNGTSNVTIEYKQAGAADAAYSQGVPTAVGSYRARATFAATDRYEEVIAYTDFEILPAYGYALKIQVADVKAGEKPSPVVTDGANNLENNSEVKYVVEYKINGAADTAYSATAPTAGGTYVARVSLYNSSGTLLKTATATFKIGKQSGNGTITVESIRYGTGTVKPVVASETNGTGNVRVEYKLAEASDSTYSTTVPTIPGKYSARAIFAPTDQYEEVVAVTKFEIYKGYGTATVSVKDIYYGMEVNAKAITNASNAGTAVLEYKQTDAEDSTYSTTVPTEIGSYTVRATYPESAYYFSFYATGKFEITYMPTPEFVLNGTTGKNEYFTSDVVVTTQPGYLISDSLDGNYAESFSLNDESTVNCLYFMEEATGAKSAGVSIAGIKIDTVSPQFANRPTADVLYSDEWTITISDLHLASVMLNGEKLDVNGNSLHLELEAEGGQKELELVATDDAGNTEKLLFTLAAVWLEEKEIPVGQPISLEAGTAYQLGEGTWQIDNDSTAYAGGSTVYIREEGQYVFSNN